MLLQMKASDIHFDPQETKLVIRYRVDGMLKTERVSAEAYAKLVNGKN